MRVLKFRAWFTDGDNKVMPGQVCSMQDDRTLYEFICDIEDVAKEHGYKYELMQFTGLLDSQGVEIYEDDLVKSSAHHPSVYRVIYDKCQYYASAAFCDVELAHFEDSTGCCLEIIGNVHHHPELLE